MNKLVEDETSSLSSKHIPMKNPPSGKCTSLLHFSIALAAILSLFTISNCSKPKDNPTPETPIACFTLSSDTILIFDTVTVNASCSEKSTLFKWASTGDPSNATGEIASFVPYNPGYMNITLTATNSKGTSSKNKTVFARHYLSQDYIGNYSCNDTCDNGTYGPYTGSITENSPGSVTLLGFFFDPVVCSVSNGVIQINANLGSGQTVVGEGIFLSNKRDEMRITYTLTDNGTSSSYSCQTMAIRK